MSGRNINLRASSATSATIGTDEDGDADDSGNAYMPPIRNCRLAHRRGRLRIETDQLFTIRADTRTPAKYEPFRTSMEFIHLLLALGGA